MGIKMEDMGQLSLEGSVVYARTKLTRPKVQQDRFREEQSTEGFSTCRNHLWLTKSLSPK